jgi:hypothetical protein
MWPKTMANRAVPRVRGEEKDRKVAEWCRILDLSGIRLVYSTAWYFRLSLYHNVFFKSYRNRFGNHLLVHTLTSSSSACI